MVCQHCSRPIPRAEILAAVDKEMRAKHKRYTPVPGACHVMVVHTGRHGCGNYSFVTVAPEAA